MLTRLKKGLYTLRAMQNYLFDDLRLNENDVGALDLQLVNDCRSALTIEMLHKVLHARVDEVDFEQAKTDVKPFLSNIDGLEIWTDNYFHQLVNKIGGV